ncbi:MAG: hypothetical protein GX267_11700 [Fibrobacter sp.]|jgi:hypothetical protein|nr:hypothetical protein [Fibrobacter sp.]
MISRDFISEVSEEDIVYHKNGELVIKVKISPETHQYLKHHIINSKPVMPLMFQCEIGVECLALCEPALFNKKTGCIRNYTPLRFAVFPENKITIMNVHLKKMYEKHCVYDCTITMDQFNSIGKLIRNNVAIAHFSIDLSYDDVNSKGFNLTIDNKSEMYNVTKDEIYSMASNPYGPLLRTRTGRFYWNDSTKILAAISDQQNFIASYFLHKNTPLTILPVSECTAAIQQVSFYSIWNGYNCTPASVGEICYYGDCGCSKGEIITFVIPKNSEHTLFNAVVCTVDCKRMIAELKSVQIIRGKEL